MLDIVVIAALTSAVTTVTLLLLVYRWIARKLGQISSATRARTVKTTHII